MLKMENLRTFIVIIKFPAHKTLKLLVDEERVWILYLSGLVSSFKFLRQCICASPRPSYRPHKRRNIRPIRVPYKPTPVQQSAEIWWHHQPSAPQPFYGFLHHFRLLAISFSFTFFTINQKWIDFNEFQTLFISSNFYKTHWMKTNILNMFRNLWKHGLYIQSYLPIYFLNLLNKCN